MSEQEMPTGDAGVEHEGSGSIEGVTRGEAGTFNAATGGRAARAHRSLGEEVARPGEEGRRPGRGASAARAGGHLSRILCLNG